MRVMKLVINYDLINEIKDANEPYGIMKIVRTYKKYWIGFGIPIGILGSVPSAVDKSFLPVSISMITFNIAITLLYDYIMYNEIGDFHQKEAKDNLLSLVSSLRDNDVNTDYELLLKSYLYSKNYKLRLNEDKIFEVLESKYILIPTYNYNMKVTDTSILQEHVVGSNTYVLSLGSPEKKLKLVYEGV